MNGLTYITENELKEYYEKAVELRRHFHAHPELSGRETETKACVCRVLEEAGISCRICPSNGGIAAVVGENVTGESAAAVGENVTGENAAAVRQDGNRAGADKVQGSRSLAAAIGIRAELDALPITEKTGLPFASENPGVMHACGHDLHLAAVLAFALLAKRHETELARPVCFFFQPAEETTEE